MTLLTYFRLSVYSFNVDIPEFLHFAFSFLVDNKANAPSSPSKLAAAPYWSELQSAYHVVFENHLSEPPEVLGLEGGEDEEGVLLVARRILDGALGVGDPHGGFGAHVSDEAFHRSLV